MTVRLERGEVCPDCKSANAWQQYGQRKLVIDDDAIHDAVARRAGEAAGETLAVRVQRFLPSVLAGVGAVGCLIGLWQRFAFTPLGPLERMQARWIATGQWMTWVGLATLMVGAFAVFHLRRTRLFRSIPLLASSFFGLVAGVAAAVVGVLVWYQASVLFGWQHVAMPPLPPTPLPLVRSVMEATTVILAPDEDGDACGMVIGSGAVIGRTARRAWIVTNSHVARPYLSSKAVRDVATTQPVWVYFSDGRNTEGRVKWFGPPPLDVAIVAVEIDDPPKPVQVAEAASIGTGGQVFFVPNPFRAGWRTLRGEVKKREAHDTPAGSYSLLLTDLKVQPGDSGSGIFDDLGRLIGLNFYLRADLEGGTFKPQVIHLPSETMDRIMHLIQSDALDQLDGR